MARISGWICRIISVEIALTIYMESDDPYQTKFSKNAISILTSR